MKGIITADWHLRADRPRCRTDEDWNSTQRAALEKVIFYANKYHCSVIHVGDLFHSASVSPKIINMLIDSLKKLKSGCFYITSGNHDLPYHNWDNVNSSAFGIIHTLIGAFDKIRNLNELGWAGPFDRDPEIDSNANSSIRFIHRLVFESIKNMPPNIEAISANELLNEYPDAHWIFTGDNHKSFHYSSKDRHVINPGCLIRQTADLRDYSPGVYYVDTAKLEIEFLPIIDNTELVTDIYIKKEQEREKRIAAFVESIQGAEKFTLSFLDNLESAIIHNNTLDSATISTVRAIIEESK
jgi:hypothetical protein